MVLDPQHRVVVDAALCGYRPKAAGSAFKLGNDTRKKVCLRSHAPIIGTFAVTDKAHLPVSAGEDRRVDQSLLKLLAKNLGRLSAAKGAPSTQTEIAKRAGVDQKTVSRTLAATNAPSVDKLKGFADAFKVRPWQLLVPDLDPLNPPVLARGLTPQDGDAARIAELLPSMTMKQREGLVAIAELMAAHGESVKIVVTFDPLADSPTSVPDRVA